MSPARALRAASPYLLAGLLTVAGTVHFTAPDRYVQIMPGVLPEETQRPLVYLSGAAELGCAGLVVLRRTRRIGGYLTAALFVAVFPANVQMALEGGIPGAGFPLGSPVVAWARLPLQLPLIAWALHAARRKPESQ